MRKLFSFLASAICISLSALLLPNLALADTTISSNITTDTTWTTASSTYIISGARTVNSGVTLTINPGVVVKFLDGGASLSVSGTLNAQGSTSSPIYFTSYKDDSVGGDTNGDGSATSPAAGNWRYILLNSGSTVNLGYTVVRYGGYSGSTYVSNIYNNGGTLTVATSTIAYANVYGIRLVGGTTAVTGTEFIENPYSIYMSDPDFLTTDSGNTETSGSEADNKIYISGTQTNDKTLTLHSVPYIFDAVTVAAGKTLTILPGTIIKFLDGGASLSVSGTLNAQGSTSSPIYFTSYKDDSVGGDTNGDGSATSPAAGNWRYVLLNSGSTVNLGHTVVRYGGYSGSTYVSNIYNNGGTLTVATSTIAYANVYGIRQGSGTTVISGSNIYGNGTYGAYNALTSTSTFTAINNYWGAASGPTHATLNPFGTGEQITSYIAFNQWLTSAPQIEPVAVKSGTISSDEIWDSSVGVYVVDGTLTVGAGAKLTIGNSTVVKFKTPTSGIVVNGFLVANSAATSSKIYFTSYYDDAVGGDTNGDGSASSPAAGDWNGVKVNSGGFASTSYAVIRYGGYNGSGGNSKLLWNNGGLLDVVNTEIGIGTSYGIYNDSTGTTTVLRADIHDNTYGACVTGGALNIGSSNIYDNTNYGVCNTMSTNIHAEYNYWGTSTGPYHATLNPTGGGNAVSNFVLITPYLTQMHYLWVASNASFVSGVHGKTIKYVATSTKYMYALWGGVRTWNARGLAVGGVTISTSTVPAVTDIWVEDASSTSAAFVAVYSPNYFNSSGSKNDTLTFNDYYMQQYSSSSTQQNVATHELGHAHALGHSYGANVMKSFVTTQTTLGTQDVVDYDYCWMGGSPACQ